jgi:FkbM family methyltransferase
MISSDAIFALTSLPPVREAVAYTQDCIASWRKAGLEVRAFNHPAEVASLRERYDVEFVPVEETAAAHFGKHFVPINAMLDWAARQDVPALLINADIRLDTTAEAFRRIRWLSDGGLCYFVRYNHHGNVARATREPFGIDAFLMHGRDAALFQRSFMCMGQPFWDYWIPNTFVSQQRPVYAVEFPAAFHCHHPQRWSSDSWRRCALEFARVTSQPVYDPSYESLVAMSLRVRQNVDRSRVPVTQNPLSIREWVQKTFSDEEPKLFLELGSHQGTDTAWMSEIPGVTIHAFEPDPRNHQVRRRNVTCHRAAIADRNGVGLLTMSQHGWGQEWTHSSSIRSPKNHLRCYPVTFGGSVEVPVVTLDTFRREEGFDVVDFVWADIQGAEGDMIRGGLQTLERTRYLYTEYSDDELYEGQITLKDILSLLPEFRVVELWSDDVLLENQRLKA